MSPRLVLKLSLFGVVLLLAFSVATALIPGADKWPQAVSYVVLVLAALAAIVYVRKHGEDRRLSQVWHLPKSMAADGGRWGRQSLQWASSFCLAASNCFWLA